MLWGFVQSIAFGVLALRVWSEVPRVGLMSGVGRVEKKHASALGRSEQKQACAVAHFSPGAERWDPAASTWSGIYCTHEGRKAFVSQDTRVEVKGHLCAVRSPSFHPCVGSKQGTEVTWLPWQVHLLAKPSPFLVPVLNKLDFSDCWEITTINYNSFQA